jgi:peptide chain release factor 3
LRPHARRPFTFQVATLTRGPRADFCYPSGPSFEGRTALSQTLPTDPAVAREAGRRRTFAIISHPDAGKTTLTEQLLLIGGAVREAGAVRARKAARYATSDWLEIERQRGISVSSSVMYFEHAGYRVNILDTPGHRDFSEDTYRTLVAADSAVMVIDAAKGIESQTRKLFEVCHLRGIPIFTFVNKLDRAGREPLALLDEIEDVLGIEAAPAVWPIGRAGEFRGLYDRVGERLLLFEGAEVRALPGRADAPEVQRAIGREAGEVAEALALLDGAGGGFDPAAIRRGSQTPVFFGSAVRGKGVAALLERFLELAPPPGPRASDRGPIDPARHPFSGFVFKIQANMDPGHRDRVAFVRVCSGHFVRGESALHVPSGTRIRLARSTLFQAREREEVDEAWPGDVVGLFDPGLFRIGDTLSAEGGFSFAPLPTFSPERFARVELGSVAGRKALAKGLEQLTQEGLVQRFSEREGGLAVVLGAVGELQFDVLRHRMRSEYRVELPLAPLPYEIARWPAGPLDPGLFRWSEGVKILTDREGRPVLLFRSRWELENTEQKHPELRLAPVPEPSPS